MSLIGKIYGNLVVKALHHKDTTRYSYTMYYYTCHCNLCGNDVVLPATNIRLYTDCGNHWKDKLTHKIPYKKGFITRTEISKRTGFNNSYISTLLRKGFTAEQIITKTYPKKKTKLPTDASETAKELGITRQAMSWRLKHGWVINQVDGKKVMSKPYATVQVGKKKHRDTKRKSVLKRGAKVKASLSGA